MADISDNIPTNAAAPRRAQGDAGSMEQHSLPDQILADRYQKTNKALGRNRLGYRRVLLKPGNNADADCGNTDSTCS